MPPVTPSSSGSVNGNGAAPPPTAPPPLETQSATLPSSLDTSQPDAQMRQGQTLPVSTMPKESWGHSVYHGVLNALGGANQVSLQRDPKTGQMIATSVKSGPGQQWKNIIAGALTGYAAAAATGAHGPGSTSAKIGAGFQAGQGRVQQQYDKMRKEANEDFETQQKAAASNARNALLATQNSQAIFNLAQSKVKATVEDTQRENSFSQLISEGGDGSQDLGVFHNMDEVMQKFKDDPSLHDHLANGRMVAIPHIGADGTIDGVHAALVTTDWLHAKTDRDLPLTQFEYKDGKLTSTTFTIPARAITNDDAMKIHMQQSADSLKRHDEDVKAQQAAEKQKLAEQKEAAQEPLTRARTAEALSAAQKNRSETVTAPAGDQNTMNDAAEGLASGRYLMGKDFPTRTTKDQATAQQYARAANQYSMAQYGRPYSPEIVRQESHFANEQKTQGYLSAIDRMVGTPGQEGQLDLVVRMARAAGLGTTGGAPLQDLIMGIKQRYGANAAKQYEQALSDTQSGLGTLVGNPLLGGGESDLKLKTAQKQFGTHITLDSLIGQANTAKDILEKARSSLARNNRYIQDRYGDTYAPPNAPSRQLSAAAQGGQQGAGTPPPTQPLPGAGKTISLAAARNLPQYKGESDAQITADAKKLGYTVGQ